jgi:very-short-patch-repair endonuclease
MLIYRKKLKPYAGSLRQNMTESELLLWSKIKGKQLANYTFYRQRIIGDYIVDFYCPKVKLIIELDGGQHFSEEGIKADKKRDSYFKNQGITVLRYTNVDVLENIEGVIENILAYLGKFQNIHSPFR